MSKPVAPSSFFDCFRPASEAAGSSSSSAGALPQSTAATQVKGSAAAVAAATAPVISAAAAASQTTSVKASLRQPATPTYLDHYFDEELGRDIILVYVPLGESNPDEPLSKKLIKNVYTYAKQKHLPTPNQESWLKIDYIVKKGFFNLYALWYFEEPV